MTILQIAPIVLTIVEMVKRFIPDEFRAWANPVIAVTVGLGTSYMYGGSEVMTDVLMTGLGSAGAAIGAYKIPKVIGQAIGAND